MTAPPIEKAASYDGQSRSTADDSAIVCSAQCEHADTRIAIEPPGSVHFGREICMNCDRTLRFLPKPQTLVRKRLNRFRIAQFAMCDSLNSWERGFISSVSQQRKISPKQLAILERLAATYLK
jgi:hypothetical protein